MHLLVSMMSRIRPTEVDLANTCDFHVIEDNVSHAGSMFPAGQNGGNEIDAARSFDLVRGQQNTHDSGWILIQHHNENIVKEHSQRQCRSSHSHQTKIKKGARPRKYRIGPTMSSSRTRPLGTKKLSRPSTQER